VDTHQWGHKLTNGKRTDGHWFALWQRKKKGLGQMERLEGFGRIQSLAAPFDSPFGFAQTCANQLQENLSKFRK